MDIVNFCSLKNTTASQLTGSRAQPWQACWNVGLCIIFGRLYTWSPLPCSKASQVGPGWIDRNTYRKVPLPETQCLPCVSLFVVCFLSGTRQRATLPCATTKTPGLKKHTANPYFAMCFFFAHGKSILCRVPFLWHMANLYFAVCLFFGTAKN